MQEIKREGFFCKQRWINTGKGRNIVFLAMLWMLSLSASGAYAAVMVCTDCHNPPHGDGCLLMTCTGCHSIAQGSSPAIVQGTNHHSGECTTCHTANAPDGRIPHDKVRPITTNSSCAYCHTSGAHATHHANTLEIRATCISCHTIPGVTLPTTTNASCVVCHATAVATHTNHTIAHTISTLTTCLICHPTPGAKPTSNEMASCATCHPTATHNTNHSAVHAIAGTLAKCTTCHTGGPGTASTLTTQTACSTCHTITEHNTNHSAGHTIAGTPGKCTTCHTNGPGTASALLTTCSPCHAAPVHTTHIVTTTTTAICIECHTPPGVKPSTSAMAACVSCHDSVTVAGGSPKTMPHHGAGDNTPSVCTSCHTPGVDVTVESTCAKCHSGSGPGMLFTIEQMTAAALPTVHSADPIGENFNCVVCHTENVGAMHLRSSPGTPTECIQCHNVTLHMKLPFNYDTSCLVCHGIGGPAPYLTIDQLKARANNLHTLIPKAVFTTLAGDMQITFNAGSSVCPVGTTCSYNWTFGDSTTGTGITTTHVYAAAGTYDATLKVLTNVSTSDSVTHPVTVAAANQAPTVGKGAVTTTGLTVAFKDTSTDDNLGGAATVYVNWGDGSVLSLGSMGSTFKKTYANANTYNIDHYVRDAKGLYSVHDKFAATVPVKRTVTVTTSPALAGALVQVKLGTVTKAQGNTSTSGVYTSLGLDSGNYTITITKYGYVFDCDAVTAGNQSTNVPANLTVGNATFTCTHTP